MGARFEFLLPRDDPDARAAVEEAIELIEHLHRRWSRFERSSLVAAVTRDAGAWVPVDRITFDTLALAEDIRAHTANAFAVAATPDRRAAPIELDPDDARVRIPQHATLDLAALAKGVALDEIARLFDDADIPDAFVHGGRSSALALGADHAHAPWRIRVPAGDGAHEDLPLRDACVTVSAAHAPSRGAVHIADRRTGAPAPDARVVTLVAPRGQAARADALATALAAGWDAEDLLTPPASLPAPQDDRPGPLRSGWDGWRVLLCSVKPNATTNHPTPPRPAPTTEPAR